MKYILTTGCSFTNNIRLNPNDLSQNCGGRESWPYYLQKQLGDEWGYTVLNYGGATNDNVSMCRILYYHAKRLLNEGVDGKDIILIGQWSDPNRESTWIKHKFTEEDREKYGHTLVYTENWDKEKGCFFLTGGYYYHINDDFVLAPSLFVKYVTPAPIQILLAVPGYILIYKYRLPSRSDS